MLYVAARNWNHAEDTVSYVATDRQISFIERLLNQREVEAVAEDKLQRILKAHHSHGESVTKAWASTCIDWLLTRPRKPVITDQRPVTDEGPLTAGVYQRNGEVFIVKPSKVGNLYAKRLVPINGERLTIEGETVKFEFEYAPGVVKTLTAADRMPLTDAEKLMLKYGRCICCNRRLKDESSVRKGIGPVCAKQFC